MDAVSLSELKARISEYIERVERGGTVPVPKARARVGAELLQALGLGQLVVSYQLPQIVRVAQQNLGQKLAAGKERDQYLDRPRVFGQVAQKGWAIGGVLYETPEVHQHLIWRGSLGQGGEQVG